MMVVFWPDDYLDQVARQVRVVRIREPLTAELKDHTVRIRGLLAALGLFLWQQNQKHIIVQGG